MNILFVTPTPPFPPTDGARLIVANLARELSKHHTLYLAALRDETPLAPELNLFAQVRVIARPFVPRWRRWTRNVLEAQPLWAQAHASTELRAALRDLVAKFPIQAAHFDTGLVAAQLDAVAPIATVLAAHDALTFQLRQRTFDAPRWSERLAARWQLPKMQRYEAMYYARATRVCVVTEREKIFLHTLNPKLAVRVIPNGVDTDFFAPMSVPHAPHSIGFSGVMEYAPNQAAALYFAREVLPRVWRVLPDARFTIIGKNPTREIFALANDSRIRVTGTVDDVRPHIAAQGVMVCPLRAAGGIKNKLLEALAMGKAVVATPAALEGIDAREGHAVQIARDAEALAAACVRLLSDDVERERLEHHARVWALEHSWKKTAAQYVELYQEALDAAVVR